MDQEKLERLLESLIKLPSEDETIEFKMNDFTGKTIGKLLSALSNSANLHNRKKSFLVFGIDNNTHEILGISFNPSTVKMESIPLLFWLSQHVNPKIDFRVHTFKYKNKTPIVLIEIPPAFNQPIKFDGVAYIRIGEATPKLDDYPEQERKIWSNIHKKSFEKGLAKENVSTEEVLRLLNYAKYFELTNQPVPTKTKEFVEKMSQHNLVNKNIDGSYDITNLGAILFANDLKNFPTIQRKSVRVVIYDGNNREKIMKEQEGSYGYAVSFKNLIDYINDKLPSNEDMTEVLRKEVKMYPEIAIREFVANALIHQDLSISGTGPTIEIFDNRIEITNPGEPLIDTERFIDYPPHSRNEDLASFMRQVGVCEEMGTGIDRALLNIEFYQLPAPEFEKYNGSTKITLYAKKSLRDMTISDKIRACYQHCVLKYLEKEKMTNATLRKRLGIDESNYPAASTIIRAAIKDGKIKEAEKPKEYVPIWA